MIEYKGKIKMTKEINVEAPDEQEARIKIRQNYQQFDIDDIRSPTTQVEIELNEIDELEKEIDRRSDVREINKEDSD